MTSRLTLAYLARPNVWVSAVAAASGFAGLGYEIVWTRLFANAFGHEIFAVLGVLAALFAGLAVGGVLFGRSIAASAVPGRWYAALELVIGLWALALIWLVPLLGKAAPVLIPIDATAVRQWSVTFALPMIVLAPATLAMGATLPAVEAILSRQSLARNAVGWSYAANTIGAVAGTLLTTFVAMPALGLSLTMMSLAAVNFMCAAGVGVFPVKAMRRTGLAHSGGTQRLLSLFAAGLLGIGYEVVAIRTLSQVLENTVYSFAALLSMYLLGSALGAVLHGRIARTDDGSSRAGIFAIAASFATIAGVFALANLDILQSWLAWPPHSLAGAAAMELAIAVCVFLVPSVTTGALFTELAGTARNNSGSLGIALAANTAGGALAPLVFGPLLFPLLGAKLALVLIAAGYASVAPSWAGRQIASRVSTVSVAILMLFLPLSLRFVQIPPGGAVLWHRDGMMATVSVVEDRAHDRHLEINNHFRMGGTASLYSDYREAAIPLLLHDNPKTALFLGLGTGATISAAGDYPGLSIDGVELVPEVRDSFELFVKGAPNIGRSNVRLHVADARRYVQASGDRYDVIVADVYHPWIDGAGSLYTREHFAGIRERLAAGGMFCQWLPLHQLDLDTLRTIIRTFLAEFPDTDAYLAQFSIGTPLIALIGRTGKRAGGKDWIEAKPFDSAFRDKLARLDLGSSIALYGQYLAAASDLAAFAGQGPLNTDDRQIVTFQAPAAAYSDERPGARLLDVLTALHPAAGAVSEDLDFANRLTAYWRARDKFLQLGVRTAERTAADGIIAHLAPKLLEIVKISPDFDAAYRPVLAMAGELARTDPSAARRLLEELARANPARTEARDRLAALSP